MDLDGTRAPALPAAAGYAPGTFGNARGRGVWLGLTCGLVCWLIATRAPLLQGLDEAIEDARFLARGARPTGTKVVIVALDEATLAALPKPLIAISPELAEVVAFLDRQGARAIGLDLLISEQLDAHDAAPAHRAPAGAARPAEALEGWRLGLVAGRSDRVVLPAMLDGSGRLIGPLRSWRTSDRPLGLIDVTEDHDATIRRQQLAVRVGPANVPSLALAILDAAGLVRASGDALVVADRVVPLDAEGGVRINYVGPPGTIPSVGFGRVLAASRSGGTPLVDQRGRPADFRDALVIIGVTARSLGDRHATPFARGNGSAPSLMAGPELQANVVATLADGAFLTTPHWLGSLPLVLLIGPILGAAFARLSLTRGLALLGILAVGWWGLTRLAFESGGWRVESVAVLMTGATAYALTFAFRRRLLRRLFATFLSEPIARAIVDDPGGLQRDRERPISVLFADIRGFTGFAEGRTAAEVEALLSAYFAAIVPVLEGQGATIDKFLGDGIMALFNAPSDQHDHAARAVRAATALVARVEALAGLWADLGMPGLRIGVGVNTGTAVVGAIGGPGRLDFTAIGDTVNLAARIEEQTKALGATILISDATAAALPLAERAALGVAGNGATVAVRGKQRAVLLYRVAVPGVPVAASEPEGAQA